jgi:hypothetical protein
MVIVTSKMGVPLSSKRVKHSGLLNQGVHYDGKVLFLEVVLFSQMIKELFWHHVFFPYETIPNETSPKLVIIPNIYTNPEISILS